MKILLINPPDSGRSIPEEEYGVTSIKQIFRGEPFGLEVIAGALAGHDVTILDMKCEKEDALWRSVSDFRPQVIGLTAVTCEANTVLRYARKIREASDSVIVVGGNHATCDPSYFNRSEIDYIVIGVGKKSFSELISHIQKGDRGVEIPGIAKTSAGSSFSYLPRNYGVDDLMDHCPPRYDLVEGYREHYVLEKLGMKMGFVMTAYGCTHACSFCTIPGTTGGKYLLHSPDSVIRDIGLLGDVPFIRMVDANTFGNPAASRDLCRKIKNLGIRKRFIADVRADTVVRHYDLLKEWKEAGLHAVVVGFEDIQDGRIEGYNKMYKADIIPRSIELLHELNMLIVGDFIVPPDYTMQEFADLEQFIVRNGIQVPVLSVLTPIPGTPLYERMKERIVIRDLDFYTFTNAVVPTALPEKAFYETFSELVKRLHERAPRQT
ncbi:MAG: B12-binding domain-containing radical SAM protein [Syntrophus sp. (in: bacteria)]|nr:B12-binding domain-containing radical SAM protein [Syntrophus sp. (in: bacteria)]